VIFREGDDARGEAFVIHAGSVEIKKRIDGTDFVLRTVGQGELLGDLALFRKASRSTDAVAVGDVELLVIRNERLDWLIRNRPQLTLAILKRLADMLVETDVDRAAAIR
jgi:CRP/FNR family transcriptional regulator, cyclic AMP receptor protein